MRRRAWGSLMLCEWVYGRPRTVRRCVLHPDLRNITERMHYMDDHDVPFRARL